MADGDASRQMRRRWCGPSLARCRGRPLGGRRVGVGEEARSRGATGEAMGLVMAVWRCEMQDAALRAGLAALRATPSGARAALAAEAHQLALTGEDAAIRRRGRSSPEHSALPLSPLRCALHGSHRRCRGEQRWPLSPRRRAREARADRAGALAGAPRREQARHGQRARTAGLDGRERLVHPRCRQRRDRAETPWRGARGDGASW